MLFFFRRKVFPCCLTAPRTCLQSKFSFVSSITSMKDAQIPKKLRKSIKKTIQKTTAATNIIQRKSKTTTIKVNPGSKIEKSHFQDDDDDNVSNPTSSFSSFLEKWPILTSDFYQVDALDLAPLLLGKYLRRENVVLQITEVEAYRPNDSACHGRFGITARTAPVFGPGGHAYVYLCYGLHTMLNIVADKEGAGAAVLIRSCAPISGLETIQQRRGIVTEKPVLLTGPGKVGQALGLSTEWSNHSLFTPGGLELLDGPRPQHILVGPRVGIDYALPEHVNALWRFAIAALKDFACLTAGDTIMITYQYKRYYIDILQTNPSNAISVVETDCEVEFAPPLDYEEPEKKHKSVGIAPPVIPKRFKKKKPQRKMIKSPSSGHSLAWREDWVDR